MSEYQASEHNSSGFLCSLDVPAGFKVTQGPTTIFFGHKTHQRHAVEECLRCYSQVIKPKEGEARMVSSGKDIVIGYMAYLVPSSFQSCQRLYKTCMPLDLLVMSEVTLHM